MGGAFCSQFLVICEPQLRNDHAKSVIDLVLFCPSEFAEALSRIAEEGWSGFYEGPVAESIVKAVQVEITFANLLSVLRNFLSFGFPYC